MNNLSNNILNLMRSDAYLNSNNPNHAAVAKQIRIFAETAWLGKIWLYFLDYNFR